MAAITKSHHDRAFRRRVTAAAAVACLLACVWQASAQIHAPWQRDLTPAPATPFTDLRPFTATYRFGWANVLDAAKTEVEFSHPKNGAYAIHAKGGTVGIIRSLWSLSATHDASGSSEGSLPLSMQQQEKYPKKTVDMLAYFQPDITWAMREVFPSKDPHKWRKIPIANLRDLTGAMLFVRSQPLKIGDKIVMTVFPGDGAYLVTVHVEKNETLTVNDKEMNALRLTLDIKQINLHGKEKGNLLPHSKFHRGTIWVSDDADRLPIRAEVDVFIGYVYGQLESVQFK